MLHHLNFCLHLNKTPKTPNSKEFFRSPRSPPTEDTVLVSSPPINRRIATPKFPYRRASLSPNSPSLRRQHRNDNIDVRPNSPIAASQGLDVALLEACIMAGEEDEEDGEPAVPSPQPFAPGLRSYLWFE